jgi:hypothetical protein
MTAFKGMAFVSSAVGDISPRLRKITEGNCLLW